MVATKSNRLPSFKHRRALSPRENETKETEEQNLSSDRGPYLQTVGWISRQKLLTYRPREKFFC